MRHLKVGRQLSRSTSHRKAMLSNLAISILDKERVQTTLAKAKEVRRVVERLITYGKKGGLHAIRLAARKMRIRRNNRHVLTKLFTTIGPMFKDRQGGYTKIIKLGTRKGDNAELALIELVGRKIEVPPVVEKSEKDTGSKKKRVVEKSAAAETSEVKEEGKAKPVEKHEEAAKEKPETKKQAKKEEVNKEKAKPKKEPKTKKTDTGKTEKKDTKKPPQE